jgi:uncharacterized protein (TIGR03083 family)
MRPGRQRVAAPPADPGCKDARVTDAPTVSPAPRERGLASWDPGDLAELLLPAWDDFIDLAGEVDLDAASRVTGWSARAVCVHLGSWPGARTLQRMHDEALAGTVDLADERSGDYDQQSHNEAVLDAWGAAPRAEVLAALTAAREEAAAYLSSDEPAELGRREVRSVLGPLPLSTLVAAAAYELAVHALDLAPAGARQPDPATLSAGVAALVDTTAALATRGGLTARAACLSLEAGWAFAATPQDWTTLELPAVPDEWPAVSGGAADILDVSAGRRAVAPLLLRRQLRVHHLPGLLALAPIVETVPGLPGGPALRAAVRNVRTVGRLARRIPGVPGGSR